MGETSQDNLKAKYPTLGQGWNTFDQKGRNKILNPVIVEFDPDQMGNAYYCKTSQDITEKLAISGSVGASYGGASFDAKAKFAKEITSSKNALTVLVVARKAYKAQVSNATFIHEFKSNELEALIEQGGDSYQSSVVAGVEFFCAYQFHATNTTEREKIHASLDAKYRSAVSVSGTFKSTMEDVVKETGKQYTFTRHMVGYEDAGPTAENIAEYTTTFLGSHPNTSHILSYETSPYSTIDKHPDGFDKVEKWINAYKKRQFQWKLPFSLEYMESLVPILQDEIQAVRALYQFYQQEQVDGKLKYNLDKLQGVHDQIGAWRSQFKLSTEPPKPEINTDFFERPEAGFDLEFGKYHGRDSDNLWIDIDRDSIHSLVYLKRVEVSVENVINILYTTYAYRNPSKVTSEEADTEYVTKHGGGAGIPGNAIKNPRTLGPTRSFLPGEIYAVQTAKEKFSQRDLTYHDCLNAVTLCPKGSGEAGKEVPLNSQPGGWGDWMTDYERDDGGKRTFVGFNGAAGWHLDGLQTVWVRFKPATWYAIEPER